MRRRQPALVGWRRASSGGEGREERRRRERGGERPREGREEERLREGIRTRMDWAVGARWILFASKIFFSGLYFLPPAIAGGHLRGPLEKIEFFIYGGHLSVVASKNRFSLVVHGLPPLDMFLLAIFAYGS